VSIIHDYDSIRRGMKPDPFLPTATSSAPTAPAPPLCNTVFFHPKDACVSTAGVAIINEIAKHVRNTGPRRIRVEGHTDTFGDATDNIRLSMHRAMAVRAWLVACSININIIEVVGLGSSMLRVQTGPQVSHTDNRRAEVFLIP
jgi:OOP family OmpA-OmpF porin